MLDSELNLQQNPCHVIHFILNVLLNYLEQLNIKFCHLPDTIGIKAYFQNLTF